MAQRDIQTVLFVAYGGGHVNMLIPILERLQARDDIRCVVLGLTTAAAQLARHGFESRGFASLLRPEDTAAMAHGERLAAGLPEGGVVSREESVAYLGLSYADLEEREGVEGAARLFAAKGRQSFLPLGPMRRLFREVGPDLVVATNSPRAEEAAIRCAREEGIPALCLVDLFAIAEEQRLSEPGYGNRICVLNEAVARRLRAAGRASEEVVVTGNPAFDALNSADTLLQAKQLGRFGQDEDFIILWASQPEPARHPQTGTVGDPELPERIRHHLYRLLEDHPDWRLIVRAHPSEPPIQEDLPSRVRLSDRGEPLAALLHTVDAVVTMTSTVGLEAALLGKPVISLTMSIFSAACPYGNYGIALPVPDLAGLETALERLRRRDWQPEPQGAQPGEATGRVVHVIEEMLHG